MSESKKLWPWQKSSPPEDGAKQTAEKRLDDVERRVGLIEKELGLERRELG